MTDRNEILSKVVSSILQLLKRGDLPPWKKPWRPDTYPFYHVNPVSKHVYRGINVWTLTATAQLRNYTSNRWLTEKQAWDNGGVVPNDELGQGTIVLYFEPWTPEKPYTLERLSIVFNIAQVTKGIQDLTFGKPPPLRKPPDSIRLKESLRGTLAAFKNPPSLVWGGDKAYYTPETDIIRMPSYGLFDHLAGLYETWWHELAHSTGHPKRLNRWRPLLGLDWHGQAIDERERAVEEMVAEIASAMLMAYHSMEMPNLANPAAYIQSWYDVVKNEPGEFINAAQDAQKAVDMIIGQN